MKILRLLNTMYLKIKKNKFFHSQDLLSRNVLSNVPAPKAVSSHTAIDRWSDYIGQLVGDSHHLGTLLTILQHFTHNEIQ